MYLLMLLAAFLSALQAFNLSPREDYDRDIMLKRASGVVYRFIWQEDAVARLINLIESCEEPSTLYNGLFMGHTRGLVFPGDTFWGAEAGDCSNCTDRSMGFRQKYSNINPKYFHMDKAPGVLNAQIPTENWAPEGIHFYNGEEMVSKYICLKNGQTLNSVNAANCVETADQVSQPIPFLPLYDTKDSCCNTTSGRKYLISYKKIDARFLNRVNKGVSFDFHKALEKYLYRENLGVIRWDGHNWQFVGKLKLADAYEPDITTHVDPDTGETVEDKYSKEKTTWTLPSGFFDEHFFKNKNGSSGEDICKNGCLFKIRAY